MLIRFIGGLVTTISLFIILFIIFSNLSQSKAEQFTASNENCSQVAPIRRLSQQFPAHSLVLLFCDPFTSDRLQQQSSPAAHSVHIQNIRQLQTLLHKLKQEEIIRNTLYREQQFYSPSGWYHQPQRCTRLHHPHQHLHHACIHQQHVHVSDPSGYTTPMTTSTPTNCAGSYKLPLFGAQKQCLALLDFATADQGLFSCVHDLQTDQSKVWNDWLWWTKQLALSGISSLKSHLPFYNDLAPDDPQPLPLHRTLAPPTLSGQLLHLTCRLTWPFDSRCAFANQFVVRLPKNVRNRTDLMNSIYDGSNGASPSIGVWHRRHLARLISQISSYCALWQNGRPIGYQWVSASRVPSFDSSSDASQSSDSIALILWSWGWMAIVALVLISAFFFTILIVSLKSTPDWPVFVDSDAEEETYAKYSDSLRTKSSNQSVQDQVKRLKRRQQNIEKSHNDRAHQKFDHQTIHVSGESAHPIQTISESDDELLICEPIGGLIDNVSPSKRDSKSKLMNAKQRIAKLPSQKEQQLLEKVRQSLEMKELNKNDLVTPGTSSDIRSVVSRSDSELKLTRSTKSNEENIRTLDGRKPLLRRQFESGGPAEERGKVSDTGDQGVARKEKSLHTMSDEKKRPNKQSIEEKVSKHVSIHDLLQPLPVQSIKTNVTFPASTLVFAKENAPKDTTKSEVSNKSSNNVESASFIKTESTATPFIDDKLTSVPMIKTVSEASSIKPESVEATMLKDESKTLHCSLDTATIVQAKEPIEMAEQDARTLIPAKNVEQHLTKLDEEDAKATEEVLITSYEVANLSQPTKPMKDSFLMPKTSTDLKLSQDQKLSPESPIEQKIVLELAHKSGKESNSIEKHSLMFEDDLNLQREQEMLIRKPKRVTASTTSDTSISKSESDFRETKRRRKRKNKDQRDMSVKKEQEIRKKKIDVQNKLQQSIHTSYDQSETTSDVDESNAKKKKMLVKMEKDIEDLFKVKGKDIMEEQPKSNDIVSDQSDFEARDGKSPSWEQLSNIDKSPIRTESVITSPTPEPNEMQIEGSVLYSNDNRQFFQSEAQFRLPEKFQNKPFKVVIDSPAPRKMWKKANSMTK